MKKYILLSTALIFICVILGCEKNLSRPMLKIYEAQALSGFINQSTVYPYHASQERGKLLRAMFPQVYKGMTAKEVVRLLGKPDEKLTSAATTTPGEQREVYEYMYYFLKTEELPNTSNDVLHIAFNDAGIVIWVTESSETSNRQIGHKAE